MLDRGLLTRKACPMPRRSRPASEPDLFSLEPALPKPAPPAELKAADLPDTKSAISIDGLGRMIAGWSDNEVEQPRVMVTSEALRRGLPAVESAHSLPSPADAQSPPGRVVRQPQPDDRVQEIAPGQVSAVRAASQ